MIYSWSTVVHKLGVLRLSEDLSGVGTHSAIRSEAHVVDSDEKRHKKMKPTTDMIASPEGNLLCHHDQVKLLNLIKACGKEKNLCKARKLHGGVLEKGLIFEGIYIASALITTYTKCGALLEARALFEKIPNPNVVTWTALISGYAKHGLHDDVWKFLMLMEDSEIFPDSVTYICVLKACGINGSLDVGEYIDGEVRKQGLLEKNVLLGNTLVAMYSKCGAFDKAQEVFELIPIRNVVTWNALISGYVQRGHGNEALICFKRMETARIMPDMVTYVCILKACGIIGALDIGEEIHARIRKQGLLKKNVGLGNTLVDMYSKCGVLHKAREVFDLLPIRDVVSWNTIINGYVEHELCHEALKCFERMRDDGVCPDSITYICILRSCSIVRSVDIGKDIHVEIRKLGIMEKDVALSTAVVSMYAKCGALEEARGVFEQISGQDVVLWNALIAGYVQHGQADEALDCFNKMLDKSICPNAVTYICALKACGIVRSLKFGEEICVEVRKRGLLKNDVVIGTALVDMYSKCGVLEKAREAFEQLPVRDVVAWNALIVGYAQHGLSDEALKCFQMMEDEGVCPNAITYSGILKACGIIGSLEIGKDIEVKIRRHGLLQQNIMIGNGLLDMYSKCGAMKRAREVFEEISMRDVVSWNALISGYSQHGLGDEALKCFKEMQDEGIYPNVVTYICVLKACANVGALEVGEFIDAEMRKRGLLRTDSALGTALVDMYAKCGELEKAREVFKYVLTNTVVPWNALIAGYTNHGLGEEALKCFQEMEGEGIHPDAITFSCVSEACGMIGSLETGENIYVEVTKQGLLHKEVVLGNALVNMYAKCGATEKSLEIFERLPMHDLVSWNALIGGYAQLGQANVVSDLCRKMIIEDIVPDAVTFTLLLATCSHIGLLKEGEKLFIKMCSVYGVFPTIEHYSCTIDLFGRAGYFDQAKAVLNNVSCSGGHFWLFLTMLGACRKWGNVKLAQWTFEESKIHMDEDYEAAYVCIESIYASGSMEMV